MMHGRYHDHCPQEHLAWQERLPRVFEEIKLYAPDILCLQEVEQPVFQSQLGLTEYQVHACSVCSLTPAHSSSVHALQWQSL